MFNQQVDQNLNNALKEVVKKIAGNVDVCYGNSSGNHREFHVHCKNLKKAKINKIKFALKHICRQFTRLLKSKVEFNVSVDDRDEVNTVVDFAVSYDVLEWK